jgi:hypothetical protein
VLHVVFGCAPGNAEAPTDLGVRAPLGNEAEDLDLTVTQAAGS